MQDSGNGNGSERGGRSGLTALATPKKALRSSLKPKSPIASTSRGTGENPAALASSPVISAGPSYLSPISAYQTPVSSPSATAKGKRKAEEVDITPPDQKGAAGAPHHRATFAVPEPREDAHRPGSFSRAPSAYPHRKRARLSEPSPVHSRPGSAQAAPNAQNTGTYSSRASSRAARDASMRSADGLAPSERELARRRSLSQASIPLSALVTPHAPSLSRSSAFHMRDPRRPPKKLETGWALRVREEEEEGSPVQAWLFYVAFVLFPLWWVASVWRTPRTREVGGTDTEKAVTLDDPQIEFDAKSWRFRCRVMAVVSLFTYIPFIVLVAIFAGR
ncbi:hypothetical protein OF83DRAFT_1205868 [Amylostereum chailletii]|nr:hypothetical protein OF83DRAFT_1205868 [Amylostereum chailletii]